MVHFNFNRKKSDEAENTTGQPTQTIPTEVPAAEVEDNLTIVS